VKLVDKKKKKRAGKFDVNVLSFGDELVEEIVKQPEKKLSKIRDASIETDNASRNTLARDQLIHDTQSDEHNYHHNDNLQKAIFSHTALPNNIEDASPPAKPSDPLKEEQPQQDNGTGNVQSDGLKPQKSSTRTSSLVEERRSKYRKGQKTKQEREDDTIARLMSFKSKIGQRAEKHSSNDAAAVDNSLAARMARRAAAEQNKTGEEEDSGEYYYGQILDSDNEDEKNNKWLQTKFICRRHIDHTAGEDGRDIDDYEVIDDKRSRDHRQTNHKQNHKHRSKEKKHYKHEK
jgi:hypothetical protein